MPKSRKRATPPTAHFDTFLGREKVVWALLGALPAAAAGPSSAAVASATVGLSRLRLNGLRSRGAHFCQTDNQCRFHRRRHEVWAFISVAIAGLLACVCSVAKPGMAPPPSHSLSFPRTLRLGVTQQAVEFTFLSHYSRLLTPPPPPPKPHFFRHLRASEREGGQELPPTPTPVSDRVFEPTRRGRLDLPQVRQPLSGGPLSPSLVPFPPASPVAVGRSAARKCLLNCN